MKQQSYLGDPGTVLVPLHVSRFKLIAAPIIRLDAPESAD